jgi:predicted dienelactone hydrolase
MSLKNRISILLLCICSFAYLIPLSAQLKNIGSEDFLFGDALPDAPELATRGEFKVGVQTLELVNPDQLDILRAKPGIVPKYDRKLTVEVWYPAQLTRAQEQLVRYDEVLGMSSDPKRPLIPFTFLGRANRDATPRQTTGGYPLVIVSHGYVGSRYLMTYLTEHLASQGYIVAAIAHTESTFSDAGGFASTLLNRAKDIKFVLDRMTTLGNSREHWLSKLVNTNNTAVIGYSMGGYGALNVGGAGYSDGAVEFFKTMAQGSDALKTLAASNGEYQKSFDPRVKAIVAFAPWGMERGVWDGKGLSGLRVPTLFIAGSQDDISGYEKGIKAIYEGAQNTERYLLTYLNARHNVAPNPPPVEALRPGLHIDEYYRYAEPTWDEYRINNINQHFVSAFLGMKLKKKDYKKYLDVPIESTGKEWTGFKPRTCTGLEFRKAMPQ